MVSAVVSPQNKLNQMCVNMDSKLKNHSEIRLQYQHLYILYLFRKDLMI